MTLLGRTEPRIYTKPLRELTPNSSLGFAFADFCRDVCGVQLMPWQEWLGIHALEVIGDLDGDWHFRFRVIVVLVARQEGKSVFLKLLNLFFTYVLGTPLTVGTAQNLDIAEEVWADAVDLAEETPELADEIERVVRRNGAKALELKSGERYKIVAASRKGGRGLSADLVTMDELREQQNWDAWGAVTKTTMARPNAQVWGFSNAGDASSVVLRHLRVQGHAACGDPDGIAAAIADKLADEDTGVDESGLAIFEWSAPPNCAVDDREAWAYANPSLGRGFKTERALASACATDPEAVFRTECLCQWVESVAPCPFPDGSWEAGADPDSEIPRTEALHFGVDMSADRSKTAIAVCGMRADGLWHVELVAYRVGLDWALDWVRKQAAKGGIEIALQGRGAPISSYAEDFKAIRGCKVTECEGRDVGAWTGRFYDAVAACTGDGDGGTAVMHRSQPALDIAAKVAQTRSLGDGAWSWDRKNSTEDISPIVAATMAFGLASCGRTEGRTYASAYASEDRGLLIL